MTSYDYTTLHGLEQKYCSRSDLVGGLSPQSFDSAATPVLQITMEVFRKTGSMVLYIVQSRHQG